MSCRAIALLCLVLVAWCGSAATAFAASVTLNPADDTFISEYVSFANPNGTSTEMVIGTQGNNVGGPTSRGLIQFDLSSIPSGAVVNSVTLRMRATMAPASPVSSEFMLHRVLFPWDGLESTWTVRLDPDENWAEPGGEAGTDFSATPSGAVQVSGVGTYTFASTAQLVEDVNGWLTNPASNYGWLMKTENESVRFTARRWASREAPLGGGPVLEVQFELAQPPSIRVAEIQNGQFCLRFTVRAGKSYIVERRERVDDGMWTTVSSLPPAAATEEVVVCDALGTGTAFYRLEER
jgi:hypothetical protein